MTAYNVTAAASTNGTINLANPSSTTMTPARADNYAAGTYRFSKNGNGQLTVTATATPDSGYTVETWSSATSFTAPAGSVLKTDPTGNTATSTITSTTTLAAPAFVQYFAVTINASSGGTVSVSVDDAGSPESGASVSVFVKSGTSLSITNVPDAGYVHESTTGNTTITAASTIAVNFVNDEDADAGVDSNDYIGHNVANKYLLLKVPDYEQDLASTNGVQLTWGPANAKNSYIEIGEADHSQGTASEWGNDLLGSTFDQPARASAASNISFLDDIRHRGSATSFGGTDTYAAMATPPSEASARATANYSTGAPSPNTTASGAIPNYVGWRDHTDGHRITTTRGDKIEVIGGNYKIVSLGRGTGVAAFEMSGGIIIDAMEAPGNVTSVTWRECPTESLVTGSETTKLNGWKAVTQTVKGNEVSRYHGTQRDEFYGDELISVTGSPDENTSSISLGAGTDGTDAYVSGQSTFESGGDLGSTKAYPTKWDLRGGVAPELKQPDIYESTWASSVTEYTKVSGKVKEETHFNGGFESHTYLANGKSYWDYYHMNGALGHFEMFHGAKTEFFFGASTTIGFANRFELFVGAEQQVNLGLSGSFMVGGTLELHVLKNFLWMENLQAGLNRKTGNLNDTNVALKNLSTFLTCDDAALAANEKALLKSIKALKTDL